MSIYNELGNTKKANNSKATKTLIKNQKLHNLLLLIFLSSILLFDLFYIIKNNILGVPTFTNVIIIISLVFEVLAFVYHVIFKFNNEKRLIRIITIIIFSVPLIAYLPLFSFGDAFSIIFFIFRLIILVLLIYIINKLDNNDVKHYKIRHGLLLLGSLIILLLAFIFISSSLNRRIKYSYDDNLNGYVVDEVLNGSANVEFKDNTVKIGDNSLKNVEGDITIPSSVVIISDDAFKDSNIESIHLSSDSIALANSINNSKINKVYIDNPNTKINDLSNINKEDVKFILPKEYIDEYRLNNKENEDLFIPYVDDNECFIIYHNTTLKTEYYNKGESINLTIPEKNKSRFMGWYLNGTKLENNNIVISSNLELIAKWLEVFTYKFDYNDGIVVNNPAFNDLPESIDLVNEDNNLTLPIVEKENYRFDGWYDIDLYNDDTPLSSIEFISTIETNKLKDTSLKVHFTKKYQLIYHTNGGTLDGNTDEELIDGEEITPLTPSRLGFKFLGWYLDPEFNSNVVEKVSKAGTEVYAKWELNQPEVTLSTDIDKVYDGIEEDISVLIDHPLIDGINITIWWFRVGSSQSLQTNKYAYSVLNAQNNSYYCHIKAVYGDYSIEFDTDKINVNISKADYDLSYINDNYNNKTIKLEFNGLNQKPTIDNLPKGIDDSILVANYNYVGDFKEVGNNGKVNVTFESNSLNYNTPAGISYNVTVVNKTLTLDEIELSHIYNGQPFKPTINLVGVVDGYPVNLIINGSRTDVGKFYVDLEIDDSNNYTLAIDKVECEILKASYVINTASLYELNYNGKAQIPVIILPDGLSIDNEKTIGIKNAGNHVLELYLKNDNNNYNDIEKININLNIKPKSIIASLVSSSFTYNGNIQTPEVTFNGVISGDNIDYQVNNESINVGSYIANIAIDNSNYVITNTLSYEITKANYNIELDDLYELTYNGKNQIPSINLPSGLIINILSTVGAKDAGTYNSVDIYLNNTNPNYNNLEKINIKIKVNPKSIDAILESTELTYNGNIQTPEVTFNGVVSGDVINYTVNNNSINIGTYIANISIDNSNYVIANTVSYDIVRMNYQIDLDDEYVLTYNGKNQIPQVQLPIGLSIDNIKTIGVKNAGIYNSFVIYLDNSDSNYNDVEYITVKLIINPKNITPSLINSEFTYNGNLQVPSVTFNGVVSGDNVGYQVNNESINVGKYTLDISINNENYQIDDSINLVYEIIKADYLFSLADLYELTYNGLNQIPNVLLPEGLSIDNNKTLGVKDANTYNSYKLYLINSNNNYNDVEYVNINIKINPKSITASAKVAEFTYNGKIQTPELEFSGVLNNDNIAYNINNDSKNVNTYTADIELLNNNYEISNTVTYEIIKADLGEITYTVSNFEFTYDGLPHSVSFSTASQYTVEPNPVLINHEAEAYTNAGNYKLKVRYYASSNYNDQIAEYDFVINKREIELEFDDLTHQFDNSYYRPTVINYINLVDGDDFSVTILNSNTVSVGSYKLEYEVSGSDKNNYDYSIFDTYEIQIYASKITIDGYTINNYVGTYDGIEHTPSVTGLPTGVIAIYSISYKDFIQNGKVTVTYESSDENVIITNKDEAYVTIDKKLLNVTLSKNTFTYNGNVQYPNITLAGIVTGDTVNYDLSNNNSKNKGNYNLNISLDNNNYEINNENDLSYEILAANITITWSNLSIEYAKEALKPSASYTGLTISVTTPTNNINVGEYDAYASVSDDNYVINNETIKYNIIPYKLELNWTDTEFYYDGLNHMPSASVTPLAGDACNVSVNVEGNHNLPNVKYRAIAEIDNNNYEIDGTNYLDYTIAKGNFDVSSLEAKIAENTILTYNGNIQYPQIYNPSTKIYASDESEIIITRVGYKNVGTYTVSVKFSTNNNYYNEYTISVNLTIEKLELDISFDNDELKFNNEIRKPNVIINNLVEGDIVNVSITNTNVVVMNNIKAIFSISGENSNNYKITNDYYYSIIKGDLDLSNIIISKNTFDYNGEYQYPTITNYPYEGISIDLINSTGAKFVTDSEAKVKFILSDDLSSNWNIPADITVDMVINPSEVSISWTKLEFGYDGNYHLPEYEIVGLYNTDLLELEFDTTGYNLRGNYNISVTNIDNANYKLDKEYTVELIITYGDYDMSGITVSDVSVEYNGNINKVMGITGELPEDVEVSYSYLENPINVGTYKVIISFTSDNTNYNPIPDMEANVIVTPHEISLNWTNTTLTYNGTTQGPTASIVDTLYNSDICNITITGQAKNQGNHTAYAEIDNPNYELSNSSASYIINPYLIDVVIKSGSVTGPNFSYTFDGKVHNNITVTYDVNDLLGNDSLNITVNTTNIKATVGTYYYSLVFNNSNYSSSKATGSVTINKLSFADANVSYIDQVGGLPVGSITINGTDVDIEDLEGYVKYTYYSYTTEWDPTTYQEIDGEPTVEGEYKVTVDSVSTDNVEVSHNSIWSYHKFTYTIVSDKEIWSYDGQYNSSLFTATGNSKTQSASFTYDNESYTFTKALKLETETGKLSFTISSAKKLVLLMNGGTTIRINGISYSYTAGTPYEIELAAGSYEIIKGNGSTMLFGAILI